MRCLRQITGIKWQDMAPNTEVLEQCGTWGIEFHIKRAQLRWSGHVIRMTDDRIHKALFYGQLKTGCRTRGSQRKIYKDVLKSTLKSCSIPLNTWEATATNRPLWRQTCHTGLQEQKRLQIIKDRRTQRKNGQPPQGPATTYDCTICGLHSHQHAQSPEKAQLTRYETRRSTAYSIHYTYLKLREVGLHNNIYTNDICILMQPSDNRKTCLISE